MASAACSTTSPPSAVADAADATSWEIEHDSEASDAAANAKSDWSASEPPRVANLRDLERHCCTTNSGETEYWRCLAIAAALELNPPNEHSNAMYLFGIESEAWRQALRQLEQHRYWIRQHWESEGCELMPLQEGAETVLTDEINFCFQRMFEEEKESDMATATKSRLKKSGEALVKGHARNVASSTTLGLPTPLDTSFDVDDTLAAGFIPIDKIVPTNNPRKRFDEGELQQLADSIRRLGVLQALTVKPAGADGRFELVAGERRLRAARMAGLTTVPARIMVLSNLQTAAARMEENLNREDLSPIEEALGYQDMLDSFPGLTQEKLAEQIGRSRPHISNRLRLLKLPPAWQEKLAAGEITDHHGWALVPYADRPLVMERLLKGKIPVDPKEFREMVDDAVEQQTRPLKSRYGYWDGKKNLGSFELEPTAEQLAELDVFKSGSDGKDQRCWNVTLWEQLVTDKKRKQAEREAKAADPKAAAEARQKQAEIYNKKLYRYYVGWYQAALLRRLDDPDEAPPAERVALWLLYQGVQSGSWRGGELARAMGVESPRELLEEVTDPDTPDRWEEIIYGTAKLWLAHSFEGNHTDLKPGAVVRFAQASRIAIIADWKLDEDFLQLHSKEQLCELAHEWGIDDAAHEKMKRGDLIADMLKAGADVHVPKRLEKPKPVGLW